MARSKATTTAKPKTRSIGALVSDLARQFRASFDRQGRGLGLTRPQWRLLLYLRQNEGMTQTELAAALELATPTVANLVHRLIKRGWIEMRIDPSHRLNKYLYLQPIVRPLLDDVRKVAQSIDRQALRGFSEAECHALYEMLRKLKINVVETGMKPANGGVSSPAVRSRANRTTELVKLQRPTQQQRSGTQRP